MFKSQMKFQKILFLVLLFLQVALFLYSVGLTTDFYPLYLCDAYGELPGAIEFFNNIQSYNSLLIKSVIVLILLSVLPFIFQSNKRRKYYIDNFITQVLQAVGYIAVAVMLIIETSLYKTEFLATVDIAEYATICKAHGWYFSGTTIFLDLGYVFAALLIIAAGVMVFNYLWKKKLVDTEEKILNGELSNDSEQELVSEEK